MTSAADGHNFNLLNFQGQDIYQGTRGARSPIDCPDLVLWNDIVDLICEKYKETVDSESAVCEHLEEYCKFREACVINFMTRERLREERRETEGDDSKCDCSCSSLKENDG